ncbi:hypothetical protein FQN54_008220 [Arachnomyces sp. PD_36]|nr:hypothetical protein FQN54_008220 [Arachnomyces sp. PD_36]
MSTSDISYLPQDIFFIVLNYLEPWDVVRCRSVSRSWQQAFSNPQNLGLILKQQFPLAREVRRIREDCDLSNGAPEGIYSAENDKRWRTAFDQVAARYYHLSRGKPRSTQKYDIWGNPGDPSRKWYPVQPWDSHKSHRMERVDYLFEPSSFWTYEDGLLVYPSNGERHISLLDLESNKSYKVPFDTDGKVVRRLRIQQRVLVIEWAESAAFHWLNGHDGVHRHFATLFDVVPFHDSDASERWKVTFRNEIKIMFLGHPLGDRDRFFSSHNRTHYTIYAWQPNRSLYTADEDAPIESLFVWDISKPSTNRPSEDPSGYQSQEEDGPHIVARFGFRDLEFYSVRQRGVPAMIRLEVDSDAGTVDITENFCRQPQYTDFPSPLTPPPGCATSPQFPWSTSVQITSIPFIGQGPCWRRKAGVSYPPYRGNSSMQTEPLSSGWHWYADVSEAADRESQVFYSLRFYSDSCRWDSMKILLTVWTPRSEATMDHLSTSEIAFKGRIAGDERFLVGQNSENQVVVFRFDK